MKQFVVYNPSDGSILFVAAKGLGSVVEAGTGTFDGKNLSGSSVDIAAGDIVITNEVVTQYPGPARTYRIGVQSMVNGVAVLEREVTSTPKILSFNRQRFSGEASFTTNEKDAIEAQVKAEHGLGSVSGVVVSGSVLVDSKHYKVDNQNKLEKKEEFIYE